MAKRNTSDEVEPIQPEPGTVKEVEQDLEPTATPEQLAAWAKKQQDEAIDAFVASVQSPPLKRFAVRLTNHGTLLIDAPDAEAAKAEYNRQRGIIRSDHAYSIEPVTEG